MGVGIDLGGGGGKGGKGGKETEKVLFCSSILSTHPLSDIPGTEFRAATISGPPDACQRAKKMVEDIVAEVGERDNMKAMLLPPF